MCLRNLGTHVGVLVKLSAAYDETGDDLGGDWGKLGYDDALT